MERPVTIAPTPDCYRCSSNVQIGDAERILLDELAARLDHIAHQAREDLVGDIRLGDLDPKERAVGGVESRLPQLLGVHFAKALVALDRQALAAGGEDGVEELRRAGDGNALLVRFGLGRLLVRIGAFDRLRLLLLGDNSALLDRPKNERLAVDGRFLGSEAVELAALGRSQERFLDPCRRASPRR